MTWLAWLAEHVTAYEKAAICLLLQSIHDGQLCLCLQMRKR